MPQYPVVNPQSPLPSITSHSGAVAAPGRVNLIGEHIDYHQLPVLPMALARSIRVAFTPRADARIRVTSGNYGHREFAWTPHLTPVARGDWENYLRAAAQAIAGKWGVMNGIDAEIASDLPPAAGLSSSSALIVAFTLALLRANGRHASFSELMEILPDGEQFVGTRGGGMDHAASLASRQGHASLIGFVPLSVRHVPIPPDWGFLVAHSLHTAEKSGAVRELYNAVRTAGNQALRDTGFASYLDAVNSRTEAELCALAASRGLPPGLPPRRHRSLPRATCGGRHGPAATPRASARSSSPPTPACATACM